MKRKINKAKKILCEIMLLSSDSNDGQMELDRATDAMYDYIKTIENI